jgi:hypothetical protein
VLLNLVTVGVLAFVGVRLVGGARLSLQGEGRAQTLLIVKGIRWRHVVVAPFVLALVLLVAGLLIQLPVLRWGWWTAIGGIGNPVTGGTEQTSGTALEWLVPLAFLLVLLPAIPLFAQAEERMFRFGAESWSGPKRVAKAIQFGLAHAIIGIPIGVALALSIGGGYFMWCYLRCYRVTHRPYEATMESTRAHAAYNAEIVVVLLLAFVTLAIAGG